MSRHKITAVNQVAAVATGNTLFGSRLYQQMKDESGNIIMSSFSISVIMAMVAAGAGGDTLSQIQLGMSFPSSEKLALGYRDAIRALYEINENFTLEAANSIFAQSNFLVFDAFIETHQQFYAAIQVNGYNKGEFSAGLINNWVETVTQSKIKDLINPGMLNNMQARLALANSIYFKGYWASKFDIKKTTDEDFHLEDGSTKKVPMMRQTKKFEFAILEELSASMLELPYKGGRLSLQLVLPRKGNSLATLEHKLRTADLQQLFDSQRSEEKMVMTLPRFKLEQRFHLKEHLKQLGMTNMFVCAVYPCGKSVFWAISGGVNLYVSTVVQTAFIEVNEDGSEAAAATGAVARSNLYPKSVSINLLDAPEFKADRPFLFFLKDKLTGMLLFQGRVVDPSA